MLHFAQIHREFIKFARKWDDLTLEEQKGYLSRHPKTKRRITARPGSSASPTETDKTKPNKKFADLGDLSTVDSQVTPEGYLKVQKKNDAKNHLTIIPHKDGYVVNVNAGSIQNPDKSLGSVWYGGSTLTPAEVMKKIKSYGTNKEEAKIFEKKTESKEAFPVEKIKEGLKHLPLLRQGEMHDDEVSDRDDNYIEIGVRYLGKWNSRPGEEDDDYPEWDEASAKKYSTEFKEWVARQSWFNPDTMKPYISGSEKGWVSFGIKKRDLEREKKYNDFFDAAAKAATAIKNGKNDQSENEIISKMNYSLLKEYGTSPSTSWVLGNFNNAFKQKSDNSWELDKSKAKKIIDAMKRDYV
jgi:hypothetical protein